MESKRHVHLTRSPLKDRIVSKTVEKPLRHAYICCVGVVGELIRQDLLTGEKGAITHLDINVVDTSSCKPVTDAYVELWGSNATGVYTGVKARGNGDGSDTAVKTNALRGLQPTGSNGTATFITVIPGHYVGRTNHLHSRSCLYTTAAVN